MTLFFPGAVVNPQGGQRGGTWHKRARLVKSIRERVAMHVLANVGRRPPWPLSAPKRVAFVAFVHNAFDDDTLAYALKPYRDALMDMHVFSNATTKGSGDHGSRGHQFTYAQEISRGKSAKRGVQVTIELAANWTTGAPVIRMHGVARPGPTTGGSE